MSEKKFPIGIQNFEKLRKEDFFYIDKTDLIHQLVENGQYYFLSRPPRFGKSLLLSTIEAYFLGKKEWLKRTYYPLSNLAEAMATSDMLGGMDSMDENPISILYQSGYLTIKAYDARFATYTLGFPNREVEDGVIRYLLPYYTSVQPSDLPFEMIRLVQEAEQGSVEKFMLRLQSLFADTPYELVRDLELHYQNVLFIVFKLLGFYTQAEYHTSDGRIDLVVKTRKFIYWMEFKFEGSAEEALRQVNAQKYALPFALDARTVYKIGAIFSHETHRLEDWIIEKA